MNPIAIIQVFILLGTEVVLGTSLVSLVTPKIWQRVRFVIPTGSGILLLSLRSFLITLGLLLLVGGILGTYRLVWGT